MEQATLSCEINLTIYPLHDILVLKKGEKIMNLYLVGTNGKNYPMEENLLESIPVSIIGAFYLTDNGLEELVLTERELAQLNFIILNGEEAAIFWDLFWHYFRNYPKEDELSAFFRTIRTKVKYYKEENNEIFNFFIDSFKKEFDVDPQNLSEFINWESFMNHYFYNNPKYFSSDDESMLIEVIEEGSPDYETVHH